MFTSNFSEIYYCMPKEVLDMESGFVKKLREAVAGIVVIEGIPNILEMAKDKKHRLLILDDLGEESYAHSDFNKLITRISNHSEVSIILVNQNYYEAKERATTISRNLSTLIIFNHRSDPTHMAVLSRKFFRSSNFISECFTYLSDHLAPSKLQYLCIDFEARSQLPNALNCRSQILSTDTPLFFLRGN